MDNRPIGFFDSGLGGLTSVAILNKTLPNEKVIYYGDTARTPYGSKSPETIRRFAKDIVGYLLSKDVKLVVIACNTVTAMALEYLREEFPEVPIIGVVEPTARKVAEDGNGKVGIIGTKVTIASRVYEKTLEELSPGIETESLACPAFVPLIEEGIIDNEIMDLTIRFYMDEFVENGDFERLILGCTHYPLIAHRISHFYPQLKLYDSSAEVVKLAKKILEERDMLADPGDDTGDSNCRCYASDLSDSFIDMTNRLLSSDRTRIKLKKLS